MHAIKSKARHLAWRQAPSDDGTKFIPFAGRYGASHSRAASDVEQAGTVHRDFGDRNHSETCLESAEEIHTRDMRARAPHPKHSNTMPAIPSTPEDRSPVEDKEAGHFSHASTDQGLVPVPQNDESVPTTRRRGRHLSRFLGKKSDVPETNLTRESSRASKRQQLYKKKFPIGQQLRAVFYNWINILLICVPVGIALDQVESVDRKVVFVVNLIAIIPLAGTLSYATEEIALRVGETMGGLLNASFGNAVELIVSIIALVKNEIVITKTSLIGSMFSNLLLVMGMCFFFGGLKRYEQFFNVTVAQTAASLLALAVGSLLIPTFFDQGSNNSGSDALRTSRVPELSHATAVILLVIYGCYLFFQLKTHSVMYNETGKSGTTRPTSKVAEGGVIKGIATIGASAAPVPNGSGSHANVMDGSEADEDIEEAKLSMVGAILTLCISTAFVGVCSEFMVDSIQAVTETGSVSPEFIGLIILPIVGNAAEHATAVTVAIKDKMDLAIGVAVGSSLQIALLVLPLVQIIGWGIGNDAMTLEFDVFQIGLLFISILLVNYLIQDGASHWLEGVLLMATYILIAVAAWFYPVSANDLFGGTA